jgi:hypothetical protein
MRFGQTLHDISTQAIVLTQMSNFKDAGSRLRNASLTELALYPSLKTQCFLTLFRRIKRVSRDEHLLDQVTLPCQGFIYRQQFLRGVLQSPCNKSVTQRGFEAIEQPILNKVLDQIKEQSAYPSSAV